MAAIPCSVSSRFWTMEQIEQNILPTLIEAADGIAPQVR